MDAEAVKRSPCDHARVVVFDDEHIVFGESCGQLGRPGLAEGDTGWVVGPRLHDGDGRASAERGLDGVDNRAFGIDWDADHIGAGEFEHVQNRRKGRGLDDHSIAEVDGGADQPVEIMESRIDAICAYDRRDRMSDIDVPVLVIVAEDDMVTPRYLSDQLAAEIVGAEKIILPTGGHFVLHVLVDEYNTAISDFIKRHQMV